MFFYVVRFIILFMSSVPLLGEYINTVYITQENYPETSAWYQKMDVKYPEANFNKIPLVISNQEGSNSKDYSWFCGYTLGDKKPVIICPNNMHNKTGKLNSVDEWALLHEAGHIKNHKSFLLSRNSNISVFYVPLLSYLAATAYISYKYYTEEQKDEDNKDNNEIYKSKVKKYLLSHGINTILFVLVNHLFSNLDERYADNFANKHADYNSLIGALRFFKLSEVFQLINSSYITLQDTCRLMVDSHPSDSSRFQKIERAVQERFDQNFSAENILEYQGLKDIFSGKTLN